MGWGPKFSHNIPIFYPEAMLLSVGVAPNHPFFGLLLARATLMIETEVYTTAIRLNGMVKILLKRDMLDIDEYSALPEYAMALEVALSSPGHIGVTWSKKVVQARFIDTSLLGGLAELQEIQHEAYPQGKGSLRAWTGLYNAWLSGKDTRIGNTLRKRTSIMMTNRVAPFMELVELGNDMYPAYPQHGGKFTLQHFKPIYRREMSAAYYRVRVTIQLIINSVMASQMAPAIYTIGASTQVGFTWLSLRGNTIFVVRNTLRVISNRLVGSGFMLSPQGEVLKAWSGWLPK